MSTKSSWGFLEVVDKKKLHIYHEGLDGRYYLETNTDRIELPEKIAKEWGKILDKMMNDVSKQKSEVVA